MFGHDEQDHDDNIQAHHDTGEHQDEHKPADDIIQPSDTSDDNPKEDGWQPISGKSALMRTLNK